MQTFSQTHQDLFVLYMNRKKTNGTFLEIGSNHPINNNNTYLLESEYQWKGIMIEYDKSFESLYSTHRPNSVYEIKDATLVNYKELLEKYKFPLQMNYLQIDLDVDNRSTINTLILLDNTILDTYQFTTITFEHDIYTGDFYDTRNTSREIFKRRGYELLFPDVCVYFSNGEYNPYEDWYVHPNLVDMDMIRLCKTDQSMNSSDIIEKISHL